MMPKERKMIHRPDCVPGNRSPRCYCQLRKARQEAESMIWRDLGHESPEAYTAWLKRISSRDTPFKSECDGQQI